MDAEPRGYFSATAPGTMAGTLYRFELDGQGPFPDPASRFQPDGPHGPSRVVDPARFRWSDAGWRGARPEGQVLYEMHVGTFTPRGTWAAAAECLPDLAGLGVTVLELMPVAEFPGSFGWGYDGVDLFAPYHRYGDPEDFRHFVDRAHASGLGVILDVVYNHLGPDGNYLGRFAADYFTDRYANEWGEAINFDGPQAAAVREFFITNAEYWITEFHLDGLRLDATQQIFDASEEHIVARIGRAAREAAGDRQILLVAENEPQESRTVRGPDAGGFGLDAIWNDDFHHSAIVALTGRNDAYYSDYYGTPQELLSALRWGFLYQGQRSRWQKKRRGTPAFDLPGAAFVNYLQNHDQVANSARGERIHQLAGPGQLRAMTALLLLAPATPMLFQGQEFAASAPFLYFADHEPELARNVQRGRAGFLRQFRTLADPAISEMIDDPSDPGTFSRCKLDYSERSRNAGVLALHHDLLRLRRDDPVLAAQRRERVNGAVLGAAALVARFFGDASDDRLLVVNLGRDLDLDPGPEPLLAPPAAGAWQVAWSSEDPGYGGGGTAPLETDEGWRIPGHAAVLLAPETSASSMTRA
jgi:maltooligosyltrehalose trehalohydrolase